MPPGIRRQKKTRGNKIGEWMKGKNKGNYNEGTRWDLISSCSWHLMGLPLLGIHHQSQGHYWSETPLDPSHQVRSRTAYPAARDSTTETQNPSSIHKAHGRNVMEYLLFAWMNASLTALMKFNSILFASFHSSQLSHCSCRLQTHYSYSVYYPGSS